MIATDKIWLKNYPETLPRDIDLSCYKNVVELIDSCFKKYKDLNAYSNMGKTMTYNELDGMSGAFASYLQQIGLEKGDKLAIMMPNLLQYPIALYGAMRAGVTVVNVNPLYTPREMKHQFNDSGCKAIVIAENYASNLEQILFDTSIKHMVVTSLGEMLDFPKRHIVNLVVRKIKKLVPSFDLKQAITFSDAIKKGKRQLYKNVSSDKEDTILIQYTGGTTGVAKGAMLTNKNILANMLQVRSIIRSNDKIREGKETAICPLPLYHIFAFTAHCMALFSIGTHNVLITNPRDQKSLAKDMSAYPFQVITGVNTLFNAMINNPIFKKVDYKKLSVTIGGGMAVQMPVAKAWHEMTGCPLVEGYGLTETSPVLCVNPIDGSGKLGCIGMPVPSTEVRIVDENKNVLDIREVGELQGRGPQIMKGYYNRPDDTNEVLSEDGWLSTGDIAFMDEDGYFKIVDRKKDMILVSGFNVYPNEVEEVAVSHPKVLEAAAVGVPDEKSTEAVKLFIVKSDGSLTEDELKTYMREQLTGYKMPKHVEFKKELPKSNVGKILRRKLRE